MTLEHPPAATEPGVEERVRARIRSDLGTSTFRPRPYRYLYFVLHQALFWSFVLTIALVRPPVYVALPLGLIAGVVLAAQAFLAHEALHGALGGPQWMRLSAGWLGFGPELIPPSFWLRWHNVAHHGNTNMGDSDPDNFGTLRRYERRPGLARFTKLAPGSGTWYSYFFLLYSFTFHALVVLFMQTPHRREFKGAPRKRWMAQVALCTVPWIGLGWLSGWMAIFSVAVPFMTINAIGQSFILTNHFLRGMSETNDPLTDSMSVRSWAITDFVFYRFSHHVEHHLFPKMPSTSAPAVRGWIQENVPDSYACPGHIDAVAMLYKTPRVYLDDRTLCDPSGDRVTPLDDVDAALLGS